MKTTIHSAAAATTSSASAAALPALLTLSTPVRKIATFHLNGLGDLLFTLPALEAVRDTFPGATVTAVLRPGLVPLLEGSALVDDILLRPKGGLSTQAALMARLAMSHFDVALCFSQSRHTVLLAFSTRAHVRLGFTGAKMEALLTHRVPKLTEPYTVDTHLDLVRELGCNPRKHSYKGLLNISPAAFVKADEVLEQAGVRGQFIVAACEASERRGIKEWPLEHWVTTLDQLSPRWPVVLVGTKPAPEVTSRLQHPVLDLGGKTELTTLAALCGRSSLFLGIDSGVLHLAATMGTPVVGIYGPSSWELTGPRGVSHRIVRHPVECSPCFKSQCPWTGSEERKCLVYLEPAQVVRATHELLGL